MKIISKYKDYYDYMVSKYGIDPLIVYDRTAQHTLLNKEWYSESYMTSPNITNICICGEQYHILTYNMIHYHTKEELLILNDILEKENKALLFSRDNKWYGGGKWNYGIDRYLKMNNHKTDDNEKYGLPVCTDDGVLIRLTDYGIQKYISADDMFLKISSYISKQKDIDITNNQTDKEKLLSHGFDNKKSFRHRK